jgi:predicted RNA binding protein YcfA (HicA-like mRNA interferase family)
MKEVSGKRLAKILEKHGWRLMRINGRHHIYCKSGSILRLSVPIHGNKPLKSGLLHFFLKSANLTEDNV